MAQSRLVVSISAIVLLLVVFSLVKSGKEGAPNAVSDSSFSAAIIDSSGPEPLAAIPSVMDRLMSTEKSGGESSAAGIKIQVVDEAGIPVPHADFWPTDSARRTVLRSDVERPLVSSDTNGRVTLTDKSFLLLNEGHEALSISKVGYVSAWVSLDSLEEQKETVVTIRRGHEQEFLCVDTDGLPVAEAIIGLSQTLFDSGRLSQFGGSGMPGTSPHTALHVATTDSSGRAVVAGLEEGVHYYLRTNKFSMSVVDVSPTGGVTTPQSRITITFGPVVAAVILVEGDRVISHGLSFGSPFTARGRSAAALSPMRRELETFFPEAIVSVAVFDKRLGVDREVTLHLLLAKNGPMRIPVRMVPLKSVGSGQKIDPENLAANRLQMRAGTLVFVDKSGATPGIDTFSILHDDFLNGHAPIEVPHGNFMLPEGQYELKCRNPWLMRSVDSASLRVPGENVVILSDEFRECRLDVGFEWGRIGEPAHTLLVQTSDAQMSFRREAGARSQALWLPLGNAKVQVSVAELLVHEQEFEVERNLDPGAQIVPLQVPPQ